MSILATMGIKAMLYAPINAADPTVMPTTGFKAVDVYQETCSFVDKDPTITTHKSETSSKKIIQKTKEGGELKFSIMDPSMEILAAFEGGTYTKGIETTKDKYVEPDTAKDIELAFKILPQAGNALNISYGSVSAKKNTTYSAKGITLLEVTVTPTYAVEYNGDVSVPPTA